MIQSLIKEYPDQGARITFNLGLCYQQKADFDTTISTYTGIIKDAAD